MVRSQLSCVCTSAFSQAFASANADLLSSERGSLDLRHRLLSNFAEDDECIA
jgi:uncharacterized membrane protein